MKPKYVEPNIVIKFRTREGVRIASDAQRPRRRFAQDSFSNVSVYKSRLPIVHSLSALYEEEEVDFLKSIVTTDETRVHHFIPEARRVSMQKERKASLLSQQGKFWLSFFFWRDTGIEMFYTWTYLVVQ